MSPSYNDLSNLVSVLNNSNPTFKEKYDVKFSDRSNQIDNKPPDLDDLNTLLSNFIGEPNMEWIGSNCSYIEGSCSNTGS